VAALLLCFSPSLAGQAKPPLTLEQVIGLLKVGTPDPAIAQEIMSRGLAFTPTRETLAQLRQLGAAEKMLAAVETFIPLLGEARQRIPALVETLYKQLNQGERSALTSFVFKDLLDDAARLDAICVPYAYQAHYIESITEQQRRVFSARVHFLARDFTERIVNLEFVPVGNEYFLRNAEAPRDALRPDALQKAVDVARQLFYALCAQRFDVVSQAVTPNLLAAARVARLHDNTFGWKVFTDCQYPQLVVEDTSLVSHLGLKVRVQIRPSGYFYTLVYLDQVEGNWKVVRLERPSNPPVIAEDPLIRTYVLRRFGIADSKTDPTTSPGGKRADENLYKVLLDSVHKAYEAQQFDSALSLAEQALAAGDPAAEALPVAVDSAFRVGNFPKVRELGLRALETGHKIGLYVSHRHYNLLAPARYDMWVGILWISPSGVAFQGRQCSDGFVEKPYSEVLQAETRQNGFLLHLEVTQSKGKQKGYDFGDLTTYYQRVNNESRLHYQRGREDAMTTILDLIRAARSARPKQP
jgi:hypothetical protein